MSSKVMLEEYPPLLTAPIPKTVAKRPKFAHPMPSTYLATHEYRLDRGHLDG